jgi:bacteriocin-like protein
MLLINVDAVVASSSNPRRPIMNRIGTNDRKAFGVNGPQADELTESELKNVSGGEFVITKTTDSSSPTLSRN